MTTTLQTTQTTQTVQKVRLCHLGTVAQHRAERSRADSSPGRTAVASRVFFSCNQLAQSRAGQLTAPARSCTIGAQTSASGAHLLTNTQKGARAADKPGEQHTKQTTANKHRQNQQQTHWQTGKHQHKLWGNTITNKETSIDHNQR